MFTPLLCVVEQIRGDTHEEHASYHDSRSILGRSALWVRVGHHQRTRCDHYPTTETRSQRLLTPRRKPDLPRARRLRVLSASPLLSALSALALTPAPGGG